MKAFLIFFFLIGSIFWGFSPLPAKRATLNYEQSNEKHEFIGKTNKDSKRVHTCKRVHTFYLNVYTYIFTFHTLFLDYTVGVLLMRFSVYSWIHLTLVSSTGWRAET